MYDYPLFLKTLMNKLVKTMVILQDCIACQARGDMHI